ncbi:branched-chain amino acid ABC transporter permease [Roseixanthobacter glucoisosaccharinicivorans]|uniref:branched-chain amino acid ABC transporter permease n=1 Tax=Roseixanthobacter glucoisosaccharinicivorans TaxID=3119923 RepID=UPI00372A07B8
MDLFLQQLSNGLVIGSTYAVVAVGFALAFTVLRVIQFAHPDVFMIGMFTGMVAAGFVPGGGLAVALLGGAVGSTAIGAIIERTVVAPLRGRDVLTTLIATLGVSVILQNGMAVIVGPDPIPYPRLLPARFYEIGPVLLTLRQMFCLGLCAALLVLASLYVRRTHIGRATRAIAERPDVAAAFGVDVRRVCQITFWLASTMAGLAAVAVGSLYGSASAFVGLLYGLKAFICMLVAGNRYFEAVIAVGLALGVLEALVTGYVSSSLRDAVAFFVLIGVLYLRPNGLFGSYAT